VNTNVVEIENPASSNFGVCGRSVGSGLSFVSSVGTGWHVRAYGTQQTYHFPQNIDLHNPTIYHLNVGTIRLPRSSPQIHSKYDNAGNVSDHVLISSLGG